jgi:methanogenic corrinoid protein MtbC1
MGNMHDRFARFSNVPVFNTKAVVQRTGVPADTLRAWERRYGVPQPQRTEGRHRAYSERDVAQIDWLRQQTAEGLTISQAVLLLAANLEALEQRPHPDVLALEKICAACIEALLAFDLPRAEEVLTQAFSVYPIETVCLEVLQKIMEQIGLGWHSGTISIAQEHAASVFVRTKLATLIHYAQNAAARSSIVLATVPGEQHEMGVLMVMLFLLRRGWRVIYLGSNLPGDELLNAVQQVRPALVAVGAALSENKAVCAVLLQALADQPDPPILAYGGSAFHQPATRVGVPGHYLGINAFEAATRIETLLI